MLLQLLLTDVRLREMELRNRCYIYMYIGKHTLSINGRRTTTRASQISHDITLLHV